MSKAKKMLASFLLVSLVAVSFYQIFYPFGLASTLQGAASGNSGLGSQQYVGYDPYASPRPVNETAIGYDMGGGSGRTVSLPSPGTSDLQVTMKNGWSGNRVTTSIANLWDQKNWLPGGTFDTGSNTPHGTNRSTSWFTVRWYDTHKASGSNATVDQASWDSSGKYVKASMPWRYLYLQSGMQSRYYYTGEYSAWNETFIVPRGTVLAANLSLAYHPNFDTVLFSLDSFAVFVEINGHRVLQYGQGYLYSTGQANKWNVRNNLNVLTDLALNPVFDNPTRQNISISVGVIYVSSTDYFAGGPFNTENGCWFDNVTLVLKALAKPEQLKLKLAAPGLPNTNCSITSPSPSTYGQGSGTLTGFTIGPAPDYQDTYNFDITSNVTSPATGQFTANMTLYASRAKTAQTAFENIGSNVEWSVSLATGFAMYSEPVSNTIYSGYYFNISVPLDWNFTTCLDPNLHSHNIKTEANNFTISTFSSNLILRVNVTRIGSYSIDVNHPYVIHALTKNYVESIAVLRKSGGSWVSVTDFYPTQTARFSAYISNGLVPVTTGLANLTLRGPATYGASPTVVYTNTSKAPDIHGYVNFTFTLTGSFAAGNYSAQVDWVDNTLGEAGLLMSYFNITHTFRLSLAVPATGDVLFRPSVMTNPPTTVSLVDNYTGEFVTANVYGRAKWETAGRWDQFTTYSVQNATYTNQTNLPASLGLGSGNWLAVNASKEFYDDAFVNNTFYIGTHTSVFPGSSPVTIYYTESQAFRVNLPSIFYQDENSSAILGATFEVVAAGSSNNSLVNWGVRFSADYTNNGTGFYSGSIGVGTFSLYAKAIPPSETYYVLFKLSKGSNYETSFYTLRLTIWTPSSYLDLWSGNNQYVFWGATAQIKLNYTTRWSNPPYSLGPTAIRNSTSAPSFAPPFVSVACDWGGSWTVTHDAFDDPQVYTLSVNTTWWSNPTPSGDSAGTATIHIYFVRTYYQNSSTVPITVHIKSLSTLIAGVGLGSGNSTSTYSRDAKTVYVWYNDTHTGASVGVGGATLAYTFKSSLGTFLASGSLIAHPSIQGQYNLTLSSGLTDQLPGTYYLYVGGWKDPYYVHHNVTITLVINAIPTALYGFTVVRGVTQTGSQVTLTQGDTFTVYVWYNDTHNGGVVLGSSTIMYYSSQFGFGYATQVVPGEYSVSFTASAAGDWLITFNATASKYALSTLPIRIIVNAPPSFSLAAVLLVGFGGGGIVVLGVVGWLLVRRRRIPFVIKKIDETLRIITKGEHGKASAVPLRSREEAVVGITQDRIDAFAKRKPLPGAPEGKAKEEAPKGPEVEAALKTELAQVEGKEEPEEGIEEVEMDTLDQELGRIEGVEDKENLPDGAKEVRDVIEKYKEGKKKKK
ncbi:MAG: hypothetical protein WED05_07175 [Candidatus Atabeyarchaeum deiterrae]